MKQKIIDLVRSKLEEVNHLTYLSVIPPELELLSPDLYFEFKDVEVNGDATGTGVVRILTEVGNKLTEQQQNDLVELNNAWLDDSFNLLVVAMPMETTRGDMTEEVVLEKIDEEREIFADYWILYDIKTGDVDILYADETDNNDNENSDYSDEEL
jgi:hypothetical protein